MNVAKTEKAREKYQMGKQWKDHDERGGLLQFLGNISQHKSWQNHLAD